MRQSHSLKTTNALLNKIFILFFLLVISFSGYGQINENFEDETTNATTFSEGGIAYQTTSTIKVGYFLNGGCEGFGNHRYIEGTTSGSADASAGEIQMQTANTVFKINSMCIWLSTDGGTTSQSGTFKLRGTLNGGSTITTGPITVTEPCMSDCWTPNVSLIGTSLNNINLTKVEVLLPSGFNYIAIDNFNFTTSSIPANDLCINAIPLPATTANICGTTINAAADIPISGATCGTSADAFGAGVWYSFVGNGSAWNFYFPAVGLTWDPEVNVYSGTCGSFTCITGDDDSGGGLNAQFTVNTVVGTTYYMYVHPADDFGGGTSNFCFDVTVPNPTVVLNCPTNATTPACQTQAAVNAAFAAWLATASASGGCNGVLTNNNAGAPPACGGSTTVIFTYTSTCAPLTTTCQATFNVPSSSSVILTCPSNDIQAAGQTQSAINSAFATWLTTASGSGGCNGVLTNNNIGAPSALGGNTTVTFTYTSTCAPFTTTCQASFTIQASKYINLTTNTGYTTLQDAINGSNPMTMDTIELLDNVTESNVVVNNSVYLKANGFLLTIPSGTLTIPTGKNLSWLENNLTFNAGANLQNNGTLRNRGTITHSDPFTNNGTYTGNGTFNGNFNNNGSVNPSN